MANWTHVGIQIDPGNDPRRQVKWTTAPRSIRVRPERGDHPMGEPGFRRVPQGPGCIYILDWVAGAPMGAFGAGLGGRAGLERRSGPCEWGSVHRHCEAGLWGRTAAQHMHICRILGRSPSHPTPLDRPDRDSPSFDLISAPGAFYCFNLRASFEGRPIWRVNKKTIRPPAAGYGFAA